MVHPEGHALLSAVRQGQFRLTRLLLEGGAYVNEGGSGGETALMAACVARYPEPGCQARMVRYLASRGADPNIPDRAGRSALALACAAGAGPEVAQALLEAGADPAARDASGNSALVHALDRGDRATLRLLLDACAARGKEVIILATSTDPSGARTTRQYLNAPPSPSAADACASPSGVRLREEEERDTFSFDPTEKKPAAVVAAAALQSTRGRPRTLKRLNSEPWGLAAPSVPSPQERLALEMDGLSLLSKRPPLSRRHSMEGQEAKAAAGGLPHAEAAEGHPRSKRAGGFDLDLGEGAEGGQWAQKATEGHPRAKPGHFDLAPDPGPGVEGPSDAGRREASPVGGSAGRRGLLERRGSGTLDPFGPGRPGLLPPLQHLSPHPPPLLLRGGQKGLFLPIAASSSSSAASSPPKGKRLLRRHSMQPEQMKQLVSFQSLAAAQENAN